MRREAAGPAGLGFIRRAQTTDTTTSSPISPRKAFDGWLDLGVPAAGAMLLDPDDRRGGLGGVPNKTATGTARVYLQLASGQSLIAADVNSRRSEATSSLALRRPAGAPTCRRGEWQVEFISGGPALPARRNHAALRSWTNS